MATNLATLLSLMETNKTAIALAKMHKKASALTLGIETGVALAEMQRQHSVARATTNAIKSYNIHKTVVETTSGVEATLKMMDQTSVFAKSAILSLKMDSVLEMTRPAVDPLGMNPVKSLINPTILNMLVHPNVQAIKETQEKIRRFLVYNRKVGMAVSGNHLHYVPKAKIVPYRKKLNSSDTVTFKLLQHDYRLVTPYEGAIEVYNNDGTDMTRHVCSSLRMIFEQLLNQVEGEGKRGKAIILCGSDSTGNALYEHYQILNAGMHSFRVYSSAELEELIVATENLLLEILFTRN